MDRRYLILPMTAALVGGTSTALRKYGFSLIPSVALATCILAVGGALALYGYLAVSGRYKHVIVSRKTLFWFGLSGLASGVAIALNLSALHVGTVVVVAPLIGTTPLFTVILSAICLRNYETVTPKVAVGAAAICLGGIFLVALKS